MKNKNAILFSNKILTNPKHVLMKHHSETAIQIPSGQKVIDRKIEITNCEQINPIPNSFFFIINTSN